MKIEKGLEISLFLKRTDGHFELKIISDKIIIKNKENDFCKNKF